MKNLALLTLLALAMSACGGGPTSNEKATSDEDLSKKIIQQIDEQKKDLSDATEETLTEVDSLLESL